MKKNGTPFKLVMRWKSNSVNEAGSIPMTLVKTRTLLCWPLEGKLKEQLRLHLQPLLLQDKILRLLKYFRSRKSKKGERLTGAIRIGSHIVKDDAFGHILSNNHYLYCKVYVYSTLSKSTMITISANTSIVDRSIFPAMSFIPIRPTWRTL